MSDGFDVEEAIGSGNENGSEAYYSEPVLTTAVANSPNRNSSRGSERIEIWIALRTRVDEPCDIMHAAKDNHFFHS